MGGGVNIVNGNCGLSVSLLTTERTYFSSDWNNNYCCLFNWLQTAPFIRNDVVCVMVLRASFIQSSLDMSDILCVCIPYIPGASNPNCLWSEEEGRAWYVAKNACIPEKELLLHL